MAAEAQLYLQVPFEQAFKLWEDPIAGVEIGANNNCCRYMSIRIRAEASNYQMTLPQPSIVLAFPLSISYMKEVVGVRQVA